MKGGLVRLAMAGWMAVILWPAAPAHAMTKEEFGRYIAAFNAGDLHFVDYYTPDMLFDKGGEDGQLSGRKAIADWYARLWRDFREELTPLTVVIDEQAGVMMVELRTQLEARRSGVVRRGRVYARGDRLIVDDTIIYGLKDGRIASIRGAIQGRSFVPAKAGQ